MSRRQCLALLVLLAAGGCDRAASGPFAGDEYAAMRADQVIEGIEQVMTVDGIRRAVLVADTAYIFEDSARAELRRVHVTFFDAAGLEEAELTSRAGTLDIRTEAMTARDNVVLRLREGNRIVETSELHFDPERDQIWSDSATTLRQDGTVAHGDGFRSDGRLRNLEILNPRGRVPGVRFDL
ncbi:MAG TPA: LPS export ABC transporter periplasmic protein LptC [Longimicrobiales bacterium]